MLSIPIEDLIFVLCTLVGGGELAERYGQMTIGEIVDRYRSGGARPSA